jgi:hypothetical protein
VVVPSIGGRVGSGDGGTEVWLGWIVGLGGRVDVRNTGVEYGEVPQAAKINKAAYIAGEVDLRCT